VRPLKYKRLLSRRALDELGTLQALVRDLAVHRNAALRNFVASRNTTTPVAQREFWLEFSWIDQEYRVAVRKLAQFCHHHKPIPIERWASPLVRLKL
jgi:hypothetical protein